MVDLTTEQLVVLESLGNEEMAYRLDSVAATAGLSKEATSSICKQLVTLGLAEYTYLQLLDENTLAGRGYWRNSKGSRVLEELFDHD